MQPRHSMRVAIILLLALSAAAVAADKEGSRILLPRTEVLGKPVFKMELFDEPEKESMDSILPEFISLDIEPFTGIVTGMTLNYPAEVTFDGLVTEIDKADRKHRKHGFKEFGLAIWRNESNKYAIQVNKPTDSSDLYGPTMIVAWLHKQESDQEIHKPARSERLDE